MASIASVTVKVKAEVTVPCFHPGCTQREHVLDPGDLATDVRAGQTAAPDSFAETLSGIGTRLHQ